MFCRKCGEKLNEQATHCQKCGAQSPGYHQPEAAKPEKPKKKFPLVLLLVLLMLLLIAGGIFAGWYFYLSKTNDVTVSVESDEDDDDSSDLEESTDAETLAETIADQPTEAAESLPEAAGTGDPVILSQSELATTIAKYNTDGSSDIGIDVYADNYAPGTRNTSFSWDKTLFYALEDVDPKSSADGQINGYYLTRKLLRNLENGNAMEYEIYSNPATGNINKIVSIEYISDYLEITDYYYDDYAKVSFIFKRLDINYIPSYAVPTKDGERFYFNSDCMTKWRVVQNGIQANYVIGSASGSAAENPSGGVILYANLEAGAQANYDLTEKRMINAAYNTYNIVLQADGITEITGYVYDVHGAAMPEAPVVLCSESLNENLYQVTTDLNGRYSIMVPAQEHSYRLMVTGNECVATTVYGVDVNPQLLQDYQDSIYMVPQNDATYNVNVQMFDALNFAANGQGMERLSNAALYVRDGVNHREGGVVAQGTADAQGTIQVNLPPGMYTAEVVKTGFESTYYNFAASEDSANVQINASPKLNEGEVRIVLTWGEYPSDLDSHLFTPYDGSDNNHVWYGGQRDFAGNNLDVDDTTGYGPETVTIPQMRNGIYKYYVADFTNCSGNRPTSYEMSNSGAMVNVYTSDGLSATFMVPTNTSGVIWEVFEIRNGVIVPIQRYYSNIQDKSWWHNDK